MISTLLSYYAQDAYGEKILIKEPNDCFKLIFYSTYLYILWILYLSDSLVFTFTSSSLWFLMNKPKANIPTTETFKPKFYEFLSFKNY